MQVFRPTREVLDVADLESFFCNSAPSQQSIDFTAEKNQFRFLWKKINKPRKLGTAARDV